jgi:hypothetical protein
MVATKAKDYFKERLTSQAHGLPDCTMYDRLVTRELQLPISCDWQTIVWMCVVLASFLPFDLVR